MGAALRITAGVPALVFMFVGLSWWIAPEFAGTLLGMELLGGVGLSTQIADLASFFLTLGFAILFGLVSGSRVWLYPPIMLLGLAIVGRLIAWASHDAALAVGMIAVEATVVGVLLLTVWSLGKSST